MIENDIKALIMLALDAREKAYVPYSNFKVGAALLTKNNISYKGCNVENASYGAANCAERTAIFKAVSEGHLEFKAIAIVGSSDKLTFPCGICRQVMAEFFDDDALIIVATSEENYIVKKFSEILPGAFSKKDLIN